jgi:mono/diheme cytochrome c family protein
MPPPPARLRWLLIVVGPSVVLLIGSVLALAFLPHPVPRTATPAQRLYLTYCAACHGADGRGSWRAALFVLRPGNLADPHALAGRSDRYLFDLVRDGGAPIGKPGMPAFGFHLSDQQTRDVIEYVKTLSRPREKPARTGGSRGG